MKEKKIYRTPVILNPPPRSCFLGGAQIKTLSLYQNHLMLGRTKIPYAQMMGKQVQDGCVVFSWSDNTFRFAVQAGSNGSSNPALTNLVSRLITGLQTGNTYEVERLTADLKTIKKHVGLIFAVILSAVFLIMVCFAIFWEFFISHPRWLLVLVALLFGGPYAIARLYFLIVRKTVQRG